MSFYGLSTLQKINSKSASKWFGTQPPPFAFLQTGAVMLITAEPKSPILYS